MQQTLDRKTKPLGSLGRLEEIAVAIAAMTGREDWTMQRKAVLVAAADHGVSARGVSLYPSEVTRQMVLNFRAGGAAVNVLGRLAGAEVVVVDAGVRGEPFAPAGGFWDCRQGPGTRDMTTGPAMTRTQAEACLTSGSEVFRSLHAAGCQILATGDMGIGNTTASSAIAAAVTGRSVDELTGPGTGLGESARVQKVAVIEQALALNRPDGTDGLDTLAKVGGFEIGVLAGAMLEAASRRVPVMLDGFISGAAALIAARVAPACKSYFLAGHQSAEGGHRYVLEHLGLRPLLQLDMRLGEGTGAVLALHLVDAAERIVREMATFESAGVSDASSKR
jgi:nicotinate-nucleotide--dimethylbenzimidazole phosphoribosyltransferase